MKRGATPRHVGLIMDGNGRWAKKRLLPRTVGHGAGMDALVKLTAHAKEAGVEYFTLYALSTENLKNRPQSEIDGLFNLLRKYFTGNIGKLREGGTAVKIIGDISVLPQDIREMLQSAQSGSPEGAKFTLTFAINYGGRPEIVRAAQLAAASGEVTADSLANNLYTAGLPDPDLIIRTGGEIRLSNFLLWQSAYAELYFTPVLFPDFSVKEFDKALKEYSERNRRYGGIK